jgi:PII-like signaling protein
MNINSVIKKIALGGLTLLTLWVYSDSEADAKKVKILKNNQIVTVEIVDKGVAIERLMNQITKK